MRGPLGGGLLGGGKAARLPSLRQVVTRTAVMAGGNFATVTPWMVRRTHFMRDAIGAATAVRVRFGNWSATAAGGELGTGGSMGVTASVEYPAGTFTQLLFGGIAQGTMTSGADLVSDPVLIPGGIPLGAKCFTRFFLTPTVAIPFTISNNKNVALGDAVAFGGTDQTLSGTVGDNTSSSIAPLAFVALSKVDALFLLGDSKVEGLNDPADSITGDVGQLARSFGPTNPYILSGVQSESAAGFAASSTRRVALANAYCTTVIGEHAINDCTPGTVAPQIETLLIQQRALFPTLRYFWTCLAPITTGAWTNSNGSDQTVLSTCVTNRPALNAWGIANVGGFSGPALNGAAADSIAGHPELWFANGTPAFATTDGIHQNKVINQAYGYTIPPLP